jgi:hypothetical protein
MYTVCTHSPPRGLLAQEQGERARLLGGMRDALAGLKATGDSEGKLRGELLQAHQVSGGQPWAMNVLE